MATATILIPLEEYLHTNYHPDCDFVDGRIEERHLGEFDHARLQTLLAAWLTTNERKWDVYCVVEQRIRVQSRRVRIVDVGLIRRDTPREPVTVTPPLLCIEVLSPEDRIPRVCKVLDDYARMGVEHIWLFDPLERVAYVYSSDTLRIVSDRLEIAGTPIYVDLPVLFSGLD